MTTDKHPKCSYRDDGLIQACTQLDALFDPSRGLTVLTVFRDDGSAKAAVVARMGRHRDRGQQLRFCPMCGVKFS